MLEQRLREFREELAAFDDEFARYSFLVGLSAYVSPLQPDLTVDEYLQHGCQSRVWLRCSTVDGRLRVEATSDTLIIRGILHIMRELFDGVAVDEVAASDINLLDALGIAGHFSDERQLGIASICRSVVEYCQHQQAGTSRRMTGLGADHKG